MTSYAENLSQGIAIGTGVVGLLSAVVTGDVGCRHVWRRTVGRCREQQRLIETLACGSSREFVQSVLGVPQFRSATADMDIPCYSTGGAWVVVEFKSDVVAAFSITVTDPRLFVSTDRLCFDQFKVRLGRSTFGGDVSAKSSGRALAATAICATTLSGIQLGNRTIGCRTTCAALGLGLVSRPIRMILAPTATEANGMMESIRSRSTHSLWQAPPLPISPPFLSATCSARRMTWSVSP